MITATETLLPPPVIPDEVLDPLLDDRERTCEIVDHLCRARAFWVISGVCPTCPRSETRLACDEHKRLLVEDGAMCRPFLHDVTLTRVEPL